MADSGYYLFKVINHEAFWVEHQRFILMLSQWLPLLGVKLGLSLKTVLVLYSLGHVLFFYLPFLLSRYGFQDRKAGLMLVLLQTLGITSGFFVPMFELYYGAGLLVLFSSVLHHSGKPWSLVLMLALSPLILWSHPMAMLLWLFVLVIHFLEQTRLPWRSYLLFGLLLVGYVVLKTSFASEYEQGKTGAFFSNLKNWDYDWNYAAGLVKFLFGAYSGLLLLQLIALLLTLRLRKYKMLAFLTLSFLGLLLLANLAFHGFDRSRYAEQIYFPLSFVAGYAFTQLAASEFALGKRFLSFGLTMTAVVVIAAQLWSIRQTGHAFFGNRLSEMEAVIQLAQTEEGSKFSVFEGELKSDPNWSYPIETMFLSGLDSDLRMVTICTEEDLDFNENRDSLGPNDYLFRRFERFPIKTLNPDYFQLESGDYRHLSLK